MKKKTEFANGKRGKNNAKIDSKNELYTTQYSAQQSYGKMYPMIKPRRREY